MSLFDSFGYLNRDRDARVLETQSVRSVFLGLVILLFILGVNVGMAMYILIRLHRAIWLGLPVLIVLGILCFRSARIVYSRLGA